MIQPKRGFNPKTLELLRRHTRVYDSTTTSKDLENMDKELVCIACEGTGKNSKGGSCYSCQIRGVTND